MHSLHSFMEMQIKVLVRYHCASQVALVVKKPVANAGRHKRHRFNPWVRKISCKGDGNPLQYSCLENPIDREAWQAAVHRVAQSLTWLKKLSTHPCIQNTTTHLLSWLKKKKLAIMKSEDHNICWWQNGIVTLKAFWKFLIRVKHTLIISPSCPAPGFLT